MTLDAMHWVWNHSQTKGNARLVLLYVADQARTWECEARIGYAGLSQALNASRSVTKEAVRKALETGELKLVEAGKGTRPSLYRLVKAAGYVRPTVSSGPDSGPLETPGATSSGPESGTQATGGPGASGPESGTGCTGIRPSSGPESGTHSPSQVPSKQERDGEGQPDIDEYGIPAFARPLIDGLTNAGVVVRWPFAGNQWLMIHALIKKSGVAAMVDHARKVSRRTNVESAKYFMQGWRELPPLPAGASHAPTNVTLPHCGDIDCDSESRTRSSYDPKGYRLVSPCPQCHPTQQGAAA